ncbi:hypothetical protein GQ53DRAFT_743137 [Thozetella sp. PMI_491]|nr:hypothetical protein GQ53DRAFT_743137 [Thozetella sp. PMI_491]
MTGLALRDGFVGRRPVPRPEPDASIDRPFRFTLSIKQQAHKLPIPRRRRREGKQVHFTPLFSALSPQDKPFYYSQGALWIVLLPALPSRAAAPPIFPDSVSPPRPLCDVTSPGQGLFSCIEETQGDKK